jgi:NDP-sugar pyrophosphorylase family protein
MDGLILAAGRGTRLRALGRALPKPLLYLPGGTLLAHQLTLLDSIPVRRTWIVVNHLADQIAQHVAGRPGLRLVRQQPPFTLSGALASAAPHVTRPTLVLHGDNFFARNPLPDLFNTALNVFVHDASSAGDLPQRWADAGAYRLAPSAFQQLRASAAADSLRAVIDMLLAHLPLSGRPTPVWRRNINTLGDLLATQRYILEHWQLVEHPPGAEAGCTVALPGCNIVPPVWVHPAADVADSSIGPYVTVGPRACVRGSRISDALIFPDAEVVEVEVTQAAVVDTTVYCARWYDR